MRGAPLLVGVLLLVVAAAAAPHARPGQKQSPDVITAAKHQQAPDVAASATAAGDRHSSTAANQPAPHARGSTNMQRSDILNQQSKEPSSVKLAAASLPAIPQLQEAAPGYQQATPTQASIQQWQGWLIEDSSERRIQQRSPAQATYTPNQRRQESPYQPQPAPLETQQQYSPQLRPGRDTTGDDGGDRGLFLKQLYSMHNNDGSPREEPAAARDSGILHEAQQAPRAVHDASGLLPEEELREEAAAVRDQHVREQYPKQRPEQYMLQHPEQRHEQRPELSQEQRKQQRAEQRPEQQDHELRPEQYPEQRRQQYQQQHQEQRPQQYPQQHQEQRPQQLQEHYAERYPERYPEQLPEREHLGTERPGHKGPPNSASYRGTKWQQYAPGRSRPRSSSSSQEAPHVREPSPEKKAARGSEAWGREPGAGQDADDRRFEPGKEGVASLPGSKPNGGQALNRQPEEQPANTSSGAGDCPVPQHADDVKQAYLSHGTFIWREIATKTKQRQAAEAAGFHPYNPAGSLNPEPQSGGADGSEGGQEVAFGMGRPHHTNYALLHQDIDWEGVLRDLQADSGAVDAFIEEQRLLVQQQAMAAEGEAPGDEQVQLDDSSSSGDASMPLASVASVQQAGHSTGSARANTPAAAPQRKKPSGGSSTPVSVAAAAPAVQHTGSKGSTVSGVQDPYPTSRSERGYGFFGVRGHYLPTDAAIAVGPHPLDADGVLVIQGSQGAFEVNMVMLKDGRPVTAVTNNRVRMDDMMQAAGVSTDNLYGYNPSAWFDPKEKRYVLMWASGLIEGKQPSPPPPEGVVSPPQGAPAPPEGMPASAPAEGVSAAPPAAYPLFIAVSENSNPLGHWTVWALDTVPQVAPGNRFCAGHTRDQFAASTPQATFTHDAIVVSLGVYCGQFSGADDERAFLSVVYAYSKQALYATPAARSAAGGPTNPHKNNQHQQQQQPASGKQSSTLKASPASTPPPQIYAATYLSSGSWYRSVPLAGQAAVDDAYKPFNSFIQPARPQAVEDMARAPLLVMKVSDTLMSVASLTAVDMSSMTSIKTAPRIVANVVGRGADFGSADGQPDGLPVMQQPNTQRVLDAGDVGTVNRTHELRVYWATHHKDQLYLTTSEFWGNSSSSSSGGARVPSTYWAVVKPAASAELCSLSLAEWGVVASREGLALAYPVIAARKDGTAALAFAYSGAGTVSYEQSAAYPGVATINVGSGDASSTAPEAAAHEAAGGPSSSPPAVIQIVKKGSGVINRTDLSSLEPQPWGSYSAAQAWGDKLWFAVVMPQEAGTSATGSGKGMKAGVWVGATNL